MSALIAWFCVPGGRGPAVLGYAQYLYQLPLGVFATALGTAIFPLLAARACGLSPVETIIAGPEGEEEAVTFGWHPPFPSRVSLVRRYAYAEAIADRIVGQAYATLAAEERRELSTLLSQAAEAVRPE